MKPTIQEPDGAVRAAMQAAQQTAPMSALEVAKYKAMAALQKDPVRPLQPSFFDLSPAEKVEAATEIANVLKDIVLKQGFAVKISGREYVKVEGWNTLGSLLGIVPVEKESKELPDGSFLTTMELKLWRSEDVIGRGSALCGVDEKRWGGADRFARKSMSATRATGKAFRQTLSWIMVLAGYEATPAEEMTDQPINIDQKRQLWAVAQKVGLTSDDLKEVSRATFGVQEAGELSTAQGETLWKVLSAFDAVNAKKVVNQ